MKSPCLNCQNRVLYCHSLCDKYIAFKSLNSSLKENERKKNLRSEGYFKHCETLIQKYGNKENHGYI
jgi:hypothetical protein